MRCLLSTKYTDKPVPAITKLVDIYKPYLFECCGVFIPVIIVFDRSAVRTIYERIAQKQKQPNQKLEYPQEIRLIFENAMFQQHDHIFQIKSTL